MNRNRSVLTLALGFGGGRGARAQIPPVLTEPLTEVDPAESLEAGVADVDPLARGLRLLQRDLQTPSGFDRVFRVIGSPMRHRNHRHYKSLLIGFDGQNDCAWSVFRSFNLPRIVLIRPQIRISDNEPWLRFRQHLSD